MPPNKAVQGKPRKNANSHQLPDPIDSGEILTDVLKRKWKLGKSIGVGGFGEIYVASDNPLKPVGPNAEFVIKIEPHTNGPLFSEMHFYHRVAKAEQIETWMKEKKLKFLGMPKFIASGSHDYKGMKYRFMVMERFGDDLQKLLTANGKTFSVKTVLTLGLKILDVLEYIHSHGYVHADVKGSNLLLGHADKSNEKVFLVDFGLACRYVTSDGKHKEYKVDPRKAHDGTIEYTSRDAHVGVQSRRADLEILGYNMLHWLSGRLPWESHLKSADTVKKMKNEYLENLPNLMKDCFRNSTPPSAISRYLELIANLKFDDEPDYDRCRRILRDGLKQAKLKDDGKLDFTKATAKSTTVSKRKIDNNDDSENEVPVKSSRQKVGKPPMNKRKLLPSEIESPFVQIENPTPAMLLLMEKKQQREQATNSVPKNTRRMKQPLDDADDDKRSRLRRRKPISPDLF